MLIKSKFKDYYDYCVGYGVDKTVVYNREEREIRRSPSKLMDLPPPELALANEVCNGWGPDLHAAKPLKKPSTTGVEAVSVVVLGFAGKLHKGILIYRREKPQYSPYYFFPSSTYELHFNVASLPEEVREESPFWRERLTYGDYFGSELTRENTDIFIAMKAPVFLAFQNSVLINPNLSKYGFSKYKDGVTAFQEISAFIAGTLNTANALPMTTDDKSLAEAKGFDKHSFRKGPTKRRK